jgi:hypothetical protein
MVIGTMDNIEFLSWSVSGDMLRGPVPKGVGKDLRAQAMSPRNRPQNHSIGINRPRFSQPTKLAQRCLRGLARTAADSCCLVLGDAN